MLFCSIHVVNRFVLQDFMKCTLELVSDLSVNGLLSFLYYFVSLMFFPFYIPDYIFLQCRSPNITLYWIWLQSIYMIQNH